MARDAGIDYMWNDDRRARRTCAARQGHERRRRRASSTSILGIGQYPITVMDHANGMATFAAGGLRANAHFVTKVIKDGEKTVYGETLPKPNQPRILNQQAINDLTTR